MINQSFTEVLAEESVLDQPAMMSHPYHSALLEEEVSMHHQLVSYCFNT